MDSCKFCSSTRLVKNGKPKGKQRYACKDCGKEQVAGDARQIYENNIRKAALVLYLEGNGFRGTARCLSKVFGIKINFQMVVHWVKIAGNIVEKEVEDRKAEQTSQPKAILPVVEMDELYTFIKKNLAQTVQLGSGKESLPEYGLLLIGTRAIYLHLK